MHPAKISSITRMKIGADMLPEADEHGASNSSISDSVLTSAVAPTLAPARSAVLDACFRRFPAKVLDCTEVVSTSSASESEVLTSTASLLASQWVLGADRRMMVCLTRKPCDHARVLLIEFQTHETCNADIREVNVGSCA